MATRARRPRLPDPIPDQAKFDVTIHIENMTWEDMKIIVTADALNGKPEELTPELVLDIHGIFERLVEGGAKAVPVMYTMQVVNAIGAAMKDLGNPKNSKSA